MAVETAADRAVFFDVDDFGVAATYRRGVTDSTVNGIFDNEFVQVEVGEVPYDSTEPVFYCRTADLPAGFTVGDRLTVKVIGVDLARRRIALSARKDGSAVLVTFANGAALGGGIGRVPAHSTWFHEALEIRWAANTCEGFVYLDLLADSKDGSGNPTGSIERFRGQGHSCWAPYFLTSNRQQVNGTVGTDVGESGGYPTRNLDGSTVEGRSFILTGYNPNATAVKQQVLVIGGA